MSTDLPQQSTPIIIKGGRGKGITQSAIEIEANSVFAVTESFQSQQDDWIQSDSDFSISYIESLAIGEMGAGLQFCQTSTMAHPLTYSFKDDDDSTIFTIKEIADGDNYNLQINVEVPDEYFQITQGNASTGNDWSVSKFSAVTVVVSSVEVTDATNTPVCLLLRTIDQDIFLNLEPGV